MSRWETKPPKGSNKGRHWPNIAKGCAPFIFWRSKWRMVREFTNGKTLELILRCFRKCFLMWSLQRKKTLPQNDQLRVNWPTIREWEEVFDREIGSWASLLEKIGSIKLDEGSDKVFWTLDSCRNFSFDVASLKLSAKIFKLQEA